jgi:thioredoxin-related protein
MLILSSTLCQPCQRLKVELGDGSGMPVPVEWHVDDMEMNRTWRVTAVPTVILLDADGAEVKRLEGFRTKAQLTAWCRSGKGDRGLLLRIMPWRG